MSDDDGHHRDSFEEEEAPQLLMKLRFSSGMRGLSQDDQEDIAQTSRLKLLKAEQRTEIENKDAYLATTAKHESYDVLRRRKKEGAVSYDDEKDEKTRRALDRKAAEAENPIFRLIERLDAQKVFNSLPAAIWDGLDEDDFTLLNLRVVEERSFEEISEIMERSEGDVRYHFQKLLARLRYRVRKYFGDGGGPF